MNEKPTVLVAESTPEIAKFLEVALSCHGYAVKVLPTGAEALAFLRESDGAVATLLADAHLPGKSGMEILREIRQDGGRQRFPVVLYARKPAPSLEREALESGASDFLALPIGHSDLAKVVSRQLLGSGQHSPRRAEESDPSAGIETFLCLSPRMKEIRAAMRRLSLSDVPVVFYGESGVGKEVVARALHIQSHRAGKPFVKLNCAAVPSELLESELFGYERGAFTGAFKTTPGKFEQADGGTILLDEIGDMELKLQAKLLHVLQDREFQRLGGRETVRVNVRVLAATHRNLETEILEGRFRADLFFRLNVIRVDIPPLRERPEELLAFVEMFMRKHGASRMRAKALDESFKQALISYDWPGNIRELENVVQRLLVLQNPEAIAADLAASMRRRKAHAAANTTTALARHVGAAATTELPVFEQVNETKAHMEEEVIRAALELTNWNRKKAAQLLMLDYKALLYKMKKLDISSSTAPKSKGASAA
ncbi:MAG: sigma-54-dependent Fis family transcriptional regulator [Bryobacterales bacterium]|nr:sigma-54-dependent Fis family transcriptional regulator [Bryobacterales bacterium]